MRVILNLTQQSFSVVFHNFMMRNLLCPMKEKKDGKSSNNCLRSDGMPWGITGIRTRGRGGGAIAVRRAAATHPCGVLAVSTRMKQSFSSGREGKAGVR